MTRYYYDDALQAAWMCREFGVKLYSIEHYSDDSWEQAIDTDEIFKIIARYGHAYYLLEKIYISPESLPILQPQVGDLVKLAMGRHGIITEPHPQGGWIVSEGYEEGLGRDSTCYISPSWKNIEIIQRDGKAFFSPKETKEV